MISQTAEYALRAVVCLAEHPRELRTSRALAEAAELPPDYASKVLKDLARAGIVVGRRGLGGGYELTRSPRELRLIEVIDAVDPVRRIRECPLGRVDHVRLCPLHRRLDEVAASVERAFGETVIEDLLGDGRRGLCEP